MMKNFKAEIEGTGTATATGRINCLPTLIRGEVLREFEELEIQVSSMTNKHLNFIKEDLLEYLLPINALSKQKRVMCCAIRKPWDPDFKIFAAQLM